MEDEKLIEIVRQHEFIYNLKHPKYMDNNKKEIVWKFIGEQLRQSPGDCKKKWQCLRDSYRRALNKKKGKSEQEAKNMKPWRYETEMAFVAPFIVERKTKDSAGVISGDEMSDNGEESNTTEFNASEKPYIDIEVDDTPAEMSEANSTVSDDVPLKEPHQIDTKKPKAETKKAEPSLRAILIAKLLEDENKETPRGHDELDRFFLSISDTVKKFPPYEQALTKNKIFNLVSEIELQHLAPSSDSTRFTSNPSSKTSTSAKPMETGPDNRNEQIQQFFQKFNTPKHKKK